MASGTTHINCSVLCLLVKHPITVAVDTQIGLVILDLIMPGMGGGKCLEKLLKINPQAKVLIATGFLPDEATMESVEAEAKGFINKPYDMRQILKAVRGVLDGN